MRTVMIGMIAAMLGMSPAPAAISETNIRVEKVSIQQKQARAGIDPIVTGHRVSAAQLQRWEETRKLYDACRKCANSQPYPGDDLSQ